MHLERTLSLHGANHRSNTYAITKTICTSIGVSLTSFSMPSLVTSFDGRTDSHYLFPRTRRKRSRKRLRSTTHYPLQHLLSSLMSTCLVVQDAVTHLSSLFHRPIATPSRTLKTPTNRIKEHSSTHRSGSLHNSRPIPRTCTLSPNLSLGLSRTGPTLPQRPFQSRFCCRGHKQPTRGSVKC